MIKDYYNKKNINTMSTQEPPTTFIDLIIPAHWFIPLAFFLIVGFILTGLLYLYLKCVN